MLPRPSTVGRQSLSIVAAIAETRARLTILVARRTEDIENDGAIGAGLETMGYVTRRLPKVPRPDNVLDAVLSAHTAAFQHYAPLFLHVTVDFARLVRVDTHDGKHDILTGKYPRVQALR